MVRDEFVQAREVAVRRAVLRGMIVDMIARDCARLAHLPGGEDDDRLVGAAEDVIEDRREARRRDAVVAHDLVRDLGKLRELIGDGLGLHQACAGAAEDDSDKLAEELRSAAEMFRIFASRNEEDESLDLVAADGRPRIGCAQEKLG